MSQKTTSTTSRTLPFRTAAASSSRPNLMDKLMSRPSVAHVPASDAGNAEEQDAKLNGLTRSLHRRLSGLNLPAAIRPSAMQRRVA